MFITQKTQKKDERGHYQKSKFFQTQTWTCQKRISDLEQRWTDNRQEIRAFEEHQISEAKDGGTEGLQAHDVTLSAPYW